MEKVGHLKGIFASFQSCQNYAGCSPEVWLARTSDLIDAGHLQCHNRSYNIRNLQMAIVDTRHTSL
jgi:hypothetical protein